METLPLALQPPSTTYLIRPVQSEDIDALRTNCWPQRSVIQVQRVVGRALRLTRQGYGQGIVAVDGEQAIAYGQCTQWPRGAEISDLIVCESWRGRGIGTALIQWLIQDARARSIRRVEIGVALDNPRALSLYRRLGFRDQRIVHLDLNGVRTPVLYLELGLDPRQNGPM